jgi:hypothetical protein
MRCCGVRHPQRRWRVEVHDPRNKRHWFVLQLLNSDTAYFEKAGESRRRPRDQPVMDGCDMNTIVRHQTREGEQAARCGVKEVKHKPRFACASRPSNEDGPRASQDR